MKAFAYILILLCTCSSCNFGTDQQNDFYSYSRSGDLWRVPLIEPYEIISPTNSGSDDWFLVFDNQTLQGPDYFHSRDEFQLSSIQTIGILDSVIVATNEREYWPKLSGQYPSTLIIDMKTNDLFIFSTAHHSEELKERMKDLKIEKINMLGWNDVKIDFLENLKLPEDWNKQRNSSLPSIN